MKSKRNEKSKLQFSFRYIISFDIAEKQTAIYSVVRNKRTQTKKQICPSLDYNTIAIIMEDALLLLRYDVTTKIFRRFLILVRITNDIFGLDNN